MNKPSVNKLFLHKDIGCVTRVVCADSAKEATQLSFKKGDSDTKKECTVSCTYIGVAKPTLEKGVVHVANNHPFWCDCAKKKEKKD